MQASSPGPTDLLALHQAERDRMLDRAISFLMSDERIVAAWLYGSLGRDDADEWSDIDLWLVVADDHLAAIAGSRSMYVAHLGEPLLIVDAPQNAPPGGAFLSVVYPGQGGPQHVDWTWQPQSFARLPSGIRLLFDRAGIPPVPLTATDTAEGRLQEARKQVAFFWMMVPIVAKSIVRRRPWEAINLLVILVDTASQLKWLTGKQPVRQRYTTMADTPPPVEPAEQLDFLSRVADEMESLEAEADDLTGAVPTEARRQIRCLLSMARDHLV